MKQLKHPPSSTTSSHDPKLLVRETLRITADLASAPPSAAVPPVSPLLSSETTTNSLNFGVGVDRQFVDSSLRLLCCEEIDGRRWKYFTDESSCSSSSGGRVGGGCEQLKLKKKKNVIRAVSLHSPQAPIEEFMAFIRSYVVPEGFPNSVTPSYVPYMTWRALKHFFGGAMGVFTTQTLLNSVGVSKHRTTPGAVAINWILKDGAGRVGKMLYARQGKKFDYDLKQLRFAGDLLMELGAGVELVTAIVPQFFLPLACAANVAKNVGAVTSTSTRTPIYKAFAKGENIGDVTAKGECVGNLADLVKSVVLHTLNRARFTVAVESFLKTGRVPTLQDGNSRENIFNFPWKNHRPIILGNYEDNTVFILSPEHEFIRRTHCQLNELLAGPRFREAVEDPNSFLAVKPIFEKENYIVTYNPSKGNIYVLLKDQAKSDDVLKAAFHGHVLLHIIRSSTKKQSSSRRQHEDELSLSLLSAADLQAHVVDSYKMVSALYMPFKSKAKEQVKRNSPLPDAISDIYVFCLN
ncbi:Protein root UVB sensitive 6 [Capsicum annuum]|nr:Protein root UVB sensitive 6 [Capsicum annuum]